MQAHQRREKQLRRFRQAARAVGQAYEQHGLSENEVLAELEKAREQVYRERYGDG